MAGFPLVQPAACADHRRAGRLPGRAGRRRLGVAPAAAGSESLARLSGLLFVSAFTVVTLGYAAGGHQAVPVRHLRRPAVPHRIPDPARRQPRPARHDLRRAADVLPAGLVLDRRARRGAERHPGLGGLQAMGDHLDHHRGRSRVGAVVEDDPFRVRADRHHRQRGGDAGLQLAGALLRDDHGVVAAGVGADVVGSARRRPRGLGRGDRRRPVPRLRGDLVHAAVRLQRIHDVTDGAGARRRRGGAGAAPRTRSTRCAGWP